MCWCSFPFWHVLDLCPKSLLDQTVINLVDMPTKHTRSLLCLGFFLSLPSLSLSLALFLSLILSLILSLSPSLTLSQSSTFPKFLARYPNPIFDAVRGSFLEISPPSFNLSWLLHFSKSFLYRYFEEENPSYRFTLWGKLKGRKKERKKLITIIHFCRWDWVRSELYHRDANSGEKKNLSLFQSN